MATPSPELSPDELSELLTAYMPEIPGYRVLRRLGRGGMSYVYLGVQESLDRQVAIKVIAPTALKDEISKLRFEREARTIAKLQHPAIVSIHDVGRSELGLLYYVMPYLPRGHLGERDLREDEPRLLSILRSLLWALDYAHERGIVHRDIKSENVLFDNVDRPLLTDFGIAIHRGDRSRVTHGGFAMGSATHMAPEQARGEKVDGRADLYSIGVVAFEKLTGELPFQADEPLPMAVRHAVDPVPQLPPAKAHWQAFIDRALAKTPDARFASAQEMMAALDRIEQQRLDAAIASPAPAAPVRSRAGSISPTFIAVAACVVLVLAVVVALQAWGWRAGSGGLAEAVIEPAAPAPAPAPAAVALPPRAALGPVPTEVTEAAAPPLLDSLPIEADVAGMEDAEAVEADAAVDDIEAALPPDQRALRRAERQILRRRLTQPAGDNALQSLLQARELNAAPGELERLGSAWLKTAQPYVTAAFQPEVERPDTRLYEAARELATALALTDGAAWQALDQAPRTRQRARLQAALAAGSLDRLRAARAEAEALGIKPAALEPEWSRGIVLAQPGQALPGQPDQLLLRLPEGERPGLAAQRAPVTRGEYARFVAASGRGEANCRIRSAAFNLRKRRWSAPGFDQSDAQPVVCVSLADAQAYAQWRGQQDGRRYRLPTAENWAALPAADTAADCRARPAGCAGIQQVREWTAPCAGGCARQPLVGFGWREAEQPGRERDAAVEPEFGYDDVGFRLLREVAKAELEQR